MDLAFKLNLLPKQPAGQGTLNTQRISPVTAERAWLMYLWGRRGRLVVLRLDYGTAAQVDWMPSSITEWHWSLGNTEVVGGALSPRDCCEKSFTMGRWEGASNPNR